MQSLIEWFIENMSLSGDSTWFGELETAIFSDQYLYTSKVLKHSMVLQSTAKQVSCCMMFSLSHLPYPMSNGYLA